MVEQQITMLGTRSTGRHKEEEMGVYLVAAAARAGEGLHAGTGPRRRGRGRRWEVEISPVFSVDSPASTREQGAAARSRGDAGRWRPRRSSSRIHRG